MILANVAAAEQLQQHKQHGLYRIHDQPQQEKLETLRALVAGLGLEFPSSDPITPGDCADLLRQARGTEYQALVERTLLRTQSLSVYSPDNIGHFGLALERYAHFTSPIRRYPGSGRASGHPPDAEGREANGITPVPCRNDGSWRTLLHDGAAGRRGRVGC